MEVSSLQVPAGLSWEPWPVIPLHSKLPRDLNSKGTPIASPMAAPYTHCLRNPITRPSPC